MGENIKTHLRLFHTCVRLLPSGQHGGERSPEDGGAAAERSAV